MLLGGAVAGEAILINAPLAPRFYDYIYSDLSNYCFFFYPFPSFPIINISIRYIPIPSISILSSAFSEAAEDLGFGKWSYKPNPQDPQIINLV